MFKATLDKPCGCMLRTYRLIIMDLGMPVLDGKEASRIILQMQKEVQLPDQDELTRIVALTSFTSQKIVDECLAIGMKDVTFKPLKLEVLKKIMQEHFYRI